MAHTMCTQPQNAGGRTFFSPAEDVEQPVLLLLLMGMETGAITLEPCLEISTKAGYTHNLQPVNSVPK